MADQQVNQTSIPRHSDIPTVVGVGLYEKESNLAFRSWLMTRGKTLAMITDNPDEDYDEWVADYEDYRRGLVVMSNEFTLLDSLKYEWAHNRKMFVITALIVLAVIAAGAMAIHWLN